MRIFKDLGIQKLWKSDPLNGACTDTRVSVHALLRGGQFYAGLMGRYQIYLGLGMSGLNGQTEFKKATNA